LVVDFLNNAFEALLDCLVDKISDFCFRVDDIGSSLGSLSFEQSHFLLDDGFGFFGKSKLSRGCCWFGFIGFVGREDREVGVGVWVLNVDGWLIPGRVFGFLGWGNGALFGRGSEAFTKCLRIWRHGRFWDGAGLAIMSKAAGFWKVYEDAWGLDVGKEASNCLANPLDEILVVVFVGGDIPFADIVGLGGAWKDAYAWLVWTGFAQCPSWDQQWICCQGFHWIYFVCGEVEHRFEGPCCKGRREQRGSREWADRLLVFEK
jgi:hypothetical protein